MKRIAFVGVSLLLAGSAMADIFKCVDEDGNTTYANVQVRGCKRLSSDVSSPSSNTLPAVKNRPAPTPSPAGFPRVAEDTQKARDNDRRHILEQELAGEQRNLAQAKRDLADQEALKAPPMSNGLDRLQPYRDRVAQHERNIQAINREMGSVR